MDASGIGAVHPRQRSAQGIGMSGHKNEVNMIGHQHPAPHRHAMRRTVHGQQIAIGDIIIIAEEHLLTTIAPLGHMMRDPRNHKAS